MVLITILKDYTNLNSQTHHTLNVGNNYTQNIKMKIRQATIEDSLIITDLMFLAMEEILYKLIGIEDVEKAKAFLLHFVEKEDNQYSYKNCTVAELENKVVGSINIYDGGRFEVLIKPIAVYLKENFSIDLKLEKETEQGEYYIDTIGVSPNYQGQGIGSKLLKFIIEKYTERNQYTIGLLVDEDNPNAEKLYLSLGFQFVERKVLVGKRMKHYQIRPNNEI